MQNINLGRSVEFPAQKLPLIFARKFVCDSLLNFVYDKLGANVFYFGNIEFNIRASISRAIQ